MFLKNVQKHYGFYDIREIWFKKVPILQQNIEYDNCIPSEPNLDVLDDGNKCTSKFEVENCSVRDVEGQKL